MQFKELGIIEPILRALNAEGYTHPTPIQAQAIPLLLQGKDLLGCAQTGTGKTAAFAIPILQNLYLAPGQKQGAHGIRVLVVTPTRELALQIGESFSVYGRFTGIRNTVIFGGVKQNPQVNALRTGVDVLVATPGRLLDLIQQGYITLKHIQYSVLDEADKMLDMGFIHDIRKILALLPEKRQSLFFSATMSPEIVALSKKLLGNPEKVTIKPEQTTAERVAQSLYYVDKKSKPELLIHLLKTELNHSTLVFTRTKHGADKLGRVLGKSHIQAEVIHGNKSQGTRQRALGNFKNGHIKVLIATDIAARGIDVEELSHVVNYDIPNIPETYVHRIGRTGRASASGKAHSFCSGEEKPYVGGIEKLIRQKISVVSGHPFVDNHPQGGPEHQEPARSRQQKPWEVQKTGGEKPERRKRKRPGWWNRPSTPKG